MALFAYLSIENDVPARSCRSGQKPRLLRDRQVLHRIFESALLITIGMVIIPLLLTRGETLIVVWGLVLKVQLRQMRDRGSDQYLDPTTDDPRTGSYMIRIIRLQLGHVAMSS